MSGKNDVMVFVEQNEGRPADVSLELVCKGRELADRLRVGLSAVVCGERIASLAEKLVAHGCDEVHVAEDPRLRQYRTLPYARVVSEVIRKAQPQIVLFGATPVGRDLAPRIASDCAPASPPTAPTCRSATTPSRAAARNTRTCSTRSGPPSAATSSPRSSAPRRARRWPPCAKAS